MEIKLKDLRVGNLVYDPEGDECKVFNIYHAGGIDLIYDNVLIENVNIQSITPIELNGDELERLGFRKDQNNRYVTTNWTGLCFELKSQWYCYRYTNIGIIEICYGFKHVHQLQNLYYALTGIEL